MWNTTWELFFPILNSGNTFESFDQEKMTSLPFAFACVYVCMFHLG